MANKYTHEELTKRAKTSGWRLITREKDKSITDTLENLLHLTHMGMRRFTRLTNAFSKKAESHRAAVRLLFALYNFVRQHKSLRITPAMAAGVLDRMWSLEDLVEQAPK